MIHVREYPCIIHTSKKWVNKILKAAFREENNNQFFSFRVEMEWVKTRTTKPKKTTSFFYDSNKIVPVFGTDSPNYKVKKSGMNNYNFFQHIMP